MYQMSHPHPPVNGGGLGEYVEGAGTINPAALDAPGKSITDNSSPMRALCAAAMLRLVLPPFQPIFCLVTSVASIPKLFTLAYDDGKQQSCRRRRASQTKARVASSAADQKKHMKCTVAMMVCTLCAARMRWRQNGLQPQPEEACNG